MKAKYYILMMRCFIGLALFMGCEPLFASGYETPPTAYDRFWYRGTYPYKKSSRLRVSMPLYAGITYSNHSASSAVTSKLGFVGGLGFDFWGRRRSWSLGFDLLIITKGFNSGSTSYALNYLEVPIVLRTYPFDGFAIQMGPYFSPLVLGARSTTGGVSTDVKSQFKGDFGLMIGARITKRIRYQAHLGLDLRYDFGLTNVHSGLALKPRTLIAMLVLDFRL